MFEAKARKTVLGMTPYVAGRPVEEVQRELGLDHLIKLASNENPQGPSPKVIHAVEQSLADIHRYPDSNGFYLKQALAVKHGVSADCITLGNGSNDILELVASAYLERDDTAIYSEYGFVVYPLAIARSGAQAKVASASHYGHDLRAMSALVDDSTKVIYIANPNNPTGTYVGLSEMQSFLQSIPTTVLVVLDEAYVEYVDKEDYPDGLKLLTIHNNLVVTRTFSKAYGMSGMRVGYSISNPGVADMLNRVRQPFNVALPSLAAAVAALGDQDYIDKSVALNQKGMTVIVEGLNALGLVFIESVANFVTFSTGEMQAAEVNRRLLARGVIVRPLANYGLENWLRVSIGLEEENAYFLAQLSAVVEELS